MRTNVSTQVLLLFLHSSSSARLFLTLFRHSSLSSIASGRSSGLHPVQAQSCCMQVRAGCPAFAWPCEGVNRSTSLMSSSLLLQQCPACLVRLHLIVFMIGGRWPYSCCFVDLFNIARSILAQLPSSFYFTDADYADEIALLANAPAQAETLLHSMERAAAGIGLHVNAHQTEYMRFNQTGNISILNGSSLKLVNKFTYLGSSVSSTETDINTLLAKGWTANDRLSVIWK